MKRVQCRGLLALLLGALVLLLRAWPADAVLVQPRVAESGSLIVTAETAEIREGPSPGANVITVVEKGEIFLKEGRTGAWYYIRINNDAFGWISGRAVSRYHGEESDGSTPPSAAPEESRSSLYYPGSPNSYPYYYWGSPVISWEWYFYDRERYRDHSWDQNRHYLRDRDRDRHRDDGRHRSEPRSRPHLPRIRLR